MATATKKTVTVDVVTLELTGDEAQVLQDILSHVGGSPVNSRRKFASSITNALTDAGFHEDSHELFGEGLQDMGGSNLHFYDFSGESK